jgi:phage protein U
MIVEEQISARQQRARKAIQNVLSEPARQAYGDYVVQSTTGRKYRVAMRSEKRPQAKKLTLERVRTAQGQRKHRRSLPRPSRS